MFMFLYGIVGIGIGLLIILGCIFFATQILVWSDYDIFQIIMISLIHVIVIVFGLGLIEGSYEYGINHKANTKTVYYIIK